jgi:hypothetical protein
VTDHRINPAAVLAAIRDPRHRRRIIWSPSTTLATMGVEHYPHVPPDNYRRMKKVLAQLHADGHLVQRPHPHSHFTLKELAYERAAGVP